MIDYKELLQTDSALILSKILNNVIHGNNLEVLKLFPSDFADTCITSPPYYGLRNYETKNVIWDITNCDTKCEHNWEYYKTRGISGGTNTDKLKTKGQDNYQIVNPTENAFCTKCGAWWGELGQEPTVELFVKHLADIFDEVKRVLKPTGSFFLNISDSYMGGGKPKQKNIRNKSLMGVPEKIMIELINRGWILRNKVIWQKPNPVPESMVDRFTRSWEYIYFFTKNEDYYFEQQLEKALYEDNRPSGMERNGEQYRRKVNRTLTQKEKTITKNVAASSFVGHSGGFDENGNFMGIPGLRNVRDIWNIKTQPFVSARYGDFDSDHFASYPEELVKVPISSTTPKQICSNCGNYRLKGYTKIGESSYENMIGVDTSKFRSEQGIKQNMRADRECYERPVIETYTECGCDNPTYTESGIVIDPFHGTGTTSIEALRQGVNYIGIELNKQYVDISEARIDTFKKTEEMIKKRMSNSLGKFL